MRQSQQNMILNMEKQRSRSIRMRSNRDRSVVLVDDLIATGGTMEASCKLVEQLGGEVVKILFLMELAGLKGREKLAKYDVASVITYRRKITL